MKKYFTLLLIFLFFLEKLVAQQNANDYIKPNTAPFTYGSNMGYYGNGWLDETLAAAIKNAGGNSLRATLPQKFLNTYGYNIRLNTFKEYVNNLNMKEITVFMEGPAENVRDKNKYGGCTEESKIFANLYEPIWNTDGSVNTNNYYADYMYKTVQIYGPYVRFWEIWNEPDFTYNDPSAWVNRNPYPCELVNLNAPITHYIRMLRISYEVIKKLDPNDYVTVGGIGYSSFLDALLRNTDNPDGGSVTAAYPVKGGAYFDVLSYHLYPAYSLRAWDNSIGNFKFSRHSDRAAEATIDAKFEFDKVLTKYGYGTTYPAKDYIITEGNLPRKTFEWRYSSDEMQKNYIIKSAILAQKNKIRQIDYFSLAETANYDTGQEFQLMGFYENFYRDAPGSEKLTIAGKGYKTLGALLTGYYYDQQLTNQLVLPANVNGGAFKNTSGAITYVLWAKTQTDQSETANVNYQFPASLGIGTLKKYDWDYSITTNIGSVNSNFVALTGSPAFFVANSVSPPPPVVTIPAAPANLVGNLSADKSKINLSWTDNANNEIGLEIYRLTNSGTYTLLTTLGADVSTYADANFSLDAVIKYQVRAVNTAGASAYSNEISVNTISTPVPPQGDYRVYINFTSNFLASGYWNNVTTPRNGLVFSNLKNEQLIPTTVGLTVISAWENWWNAANNGGLWTSALYPVEVSNSTWALNSGSQSFKLTGLNTSMIYSLNFFSSSKSNNVDYTTNFLVNGKTVFINAYNNASTLVSLDNLIPNAQGELIITLSHNAGGVALINAMVLNAKSSSVPPPPPPVAEKQIVKINFNTYSWNATSVSGWNNTTSLPTANYSISALKDEKNVLSPLKLTLLNSWSASGDYGFSTGNNSGIYPDEVVRTFYYDDTNTARQIKLNGLEANKKYNFIFFGSWKYPWSKAITNYTINNTTVSLDPANNQSQTVRIDNVTGDINGEAIINIQKQAGSSYAFINSLIIEALDINSVLSPSMVEKAAIAEVDSNLNDNKITVYPNPFSDKIYVRFDNVQASNKTIKIELIDMSGRILKTQNLTLINNILEINMLDISINPGIYMMKISGEKIGFKTFKLIKK